MRAACSYSIASDAEASTAYMPCRNVVLFIGQSLEWNDLFKDRRARFGRGNGSVPDPKTYQTDEQDVFV